MVLDLFIMYVICVINKKLVSLPTIIVLINDVCQDTDTFTIFN